MRRMHQRRIRELDAYLRPQLPFVTCFVVGTRSLAGRALQALRNEGSIPKAIGWDLSAAAIWRPKATQNIVFRLSAATLISGDGFDDLFTSLGNPRAYYSVLANAVLTY